MWVFIQLAKNAILFNNQYWPKAVIQWIGSVHSNPSPLSADETMQLWLLTRRSITDTNWKLSRTQKLARVTSPFNKERHEHEFVSDKLSHYSIWGTHSAIIDYRKCTSTWAQIFHSRFESCEVERAVELGGGVWRARATGVWAPRRQELNCRHGNSIFLTFPPRLSTIEVHATQSRPPLILHVHSRL